MTENKDKELFLLFEIIFELESYSRKRVTIKFINKKDFTYAKDFINLEKDFIIY